MRVDQERDFSRTGIGVSSGLQAVNDNDNFLVGAGLRYFGNKGISVNIEWNKRPGRSNYTDDVMIHHHHAPPVPECHGRCCPTAAAMSTATLG